jgi:uncharacterized membrane protein YphA (DoxX/SURF4 family)
MGNAAAAAWSVLFARCVLGVIFFMAGVWKVFGHLLENALYPFHEHVIPRLALVLFLLVMPVESDRWSVDALLRANGRR